MYTVFLCGGRQNHRVAKILEPCKDILLQPAVSGEMLRGHVFLCDHLPPANLRLHCRVGVAPGDAPPALEFFKAQNIPVLTVGRSPRDTLTLSSRQELCAVISLQRRLCDLNGRCVGPAEYPVALTYPCSDTALLYAAALLLLCGKEDFLLREAPFLCQSLSGTSN